MDRRLMIAAAAAMLTACSADSNDGPDDEPEATGQDTAAQTGVSGCIINSRNPVWYGNVYSVTDVSSFYAERGRGGCKFYTWLERFNNFQWTAVGYAWVERAPGAPNMVLRSSVGCTPGYYRTHSVAEPVEYDDYRVWRTEDSGAVFISCK